MWIEQMRIRGFGSLTGDVTFHPGLNMILAPNEAGKSTLAAALFALLYGVRSRGSGSRRTQKTEDYFRYRPLRGTSFEVSGILHLRDGRRLNVWRDLEGDRLRVVDLGSGKEVSDDFLRGASGDVLGSTLTGWTRGRFEKLAFIRQEGPAAQTAFSEFADRIALLFSSDDPGAGTVQQALAALETARRQYDGLTGQGAIQVETERSRLRSQLEALQGEMDACGRRQLEAQTALEEVAMLQSRHVALTEEVRRYEYLSALAREREVEAAIASREEAREVLRGLQMELESLGAYAEWNLEQVEELTGLSARILDRRGMLEAVRESLEELEGRKGLLEERIGASKALADLDAEACGAIDLDLERVENAQRRLESVHLDARAAEVGLGEYDLTPEEASGVDAAMRALPPEERAFLLGYAEARAGLEAKLASFTQDADAIGHSIREIDQERMFALKSARNQVVLSMVVLALMCVLLVLFHQHVWIFAPPVLVCMAWAVYGIVRIPASRKLHATERDYAEGKLESRREALRILQSELDGMEERFASCAREAGLSVEGMADRCRQYNRAQGAIHAWAATQERRRDLEEQRDGALERLRTIFRSVELLAEGTAITLEEARRCAREVRKSSETRDELRQVLREMARLVEQQGVLDAETETLAARTDVILREGGIPDDLSRSEALARYSDDARKKARLLQLRQERLPAAEQAAGTEAMLAALETELLHVRKIRNEQKIRHPEFARLEVTEPASVYEERRLEAQARLGEESERLSRREKDLAVELGRVREALPELESRKRILEAALRRVDRFDAATACAREVMDRVAGDVHARWSPLLTAALNEALAVYDTGWRVRLARDMSMVLEPVDGGPLLDAEGVARHLSRGMREQLYLTMRMLLARQLGRDDPLPLLLDDPFVNADDDRFVAGMEDVMEAADSGSQVFVFSCHALRYGQLAKLNPALKEAWIDLPVGAGENGSGHGGERSGTPDVGQGHAEAREGGGADGNDGKA